MVCLTGDFVTAADDRPREQLAAIRGRMSAAAPCFACLGNHDGGTWSATRGGATTSSAVRDLLTTAGVRVLHDENVVVPGGVVLVGVPDLWSGSVSPSAAFAGLGAAADPPVVVLAHNPDSKDALAAAPMVGSSEGPVRFRQGNTT